MACSASFNIEGMFVVYVRGIFSLSYVLDRKGRGGEKGLEKGGNAYMHTCTEHDVYSLGSECGLFGEM